MNQISHFKQGNSLVILTLCISSLLVSACGVNAVKEEKISEAESCKRLKGIIGDHPNKFKSYKKTYSSYKLNNAWSADKVVPSAKECQIWEWSTGLHSYSCNWVPKDESEASANYQEATRIIESCLGSSWTAKTNTTLSGGKNTIYTNSSVPTVVSVRYFEDTTGWSWSHDWNNVIIIGDKSNLNVPMQ